MRCCQCFSAGKYLLQRRKSGAHFIAVSIIQKCAEHRWDKMHGSNRILCYRCNNRPGILFSARFKHAYPCTRKGPPEELPYRYVKRKRRFLQNRAAAVYRVFFLHPVDTVHNTSVLNHDSFRLAGRSGCINNIRKIVRSACQYKVGFVSGIYACIINHDNIRVKCKFPCKGPLCKEDLCTAVIHHILDTVLRIIRIDRQIGSARLKDCHDSDNHLK